MAGYFRIAVVALQRAVADPTKTNIDYAVDRCTLEYARGGSQAAWDMLERATKLRLAQIHEARNRGLAAAQYRATFDEGIKPMDNQTGADIVYSPDDGGWYAVMFRRDVSSADGVPRSYGRASPTFLTERQARDWATKRGATVFLTP